ncbi:hypothetical protein Bca52824_010055 [Brassica carinata]|uniref:C2H2-type domain-containing protein n=1 Tax=Brassica carinata TaxID=52824 RepID=A0A8X8BAW6_BRACI|nr:hypothetical protein Bca52824_010055 [Brassica carinata]
MKRTRDDDPSHYLHQSSDEDDEEEDSFSSGGFQPEPSSPPPPQQQVIKHFCVICSKQFSSGKAYGGHVRIHSSEYSNNKGKTKKKMKTKKRKIGLVNKEKEKEKEIDLIRADVERKIIRCCLCGKEFQTMHSLFGHMRRHPDRSWKGIRPPIPEKLNLSFLDDDDDDDENDHEDDDDEVMSRSIMLSGVTKDVRDAACCLMMLKDGKRKAAAMETANSEVRSFSYCNDEMDVKDVKMKMEIEVDVNNRQAEAKKRSLGIDLNQPCHDSY